MKLCYVVIIFIILGCSNSLKEPKIKSGSTPLIETPAQSPSAEDEGTESQSSGAEDEGVGSQSPVIEGEEAGSQPSGTEEKGAEYQSSGVEDKGVGSQSPGEDNVRNQSPNNGESEKDKLKGRVKKMKSQIFISILTSIVAATFFETFVRAYYLVRNFKRIRKLIVEIDKSLYWIFNFLTRANDEESSLYQQEINNGSLGEELLTLSLYSKSFNENYKNYYPQISSTIDPIDDRVLKNLKKIIINIEKLYFDIGYFSNEFQNNIDKLEEESSKLYENITFFCKTECETVDNTFYYKKDAWELYELFIKYRGFIDSSKYLSIISRFIYPMSNFKDRKIIEKKIYDISDETKLRRERFESRCKTIKKYIELKSEENGIRSSVYFSGREATADEREKLDELSRKRNHLIQQHNRKVTEVDSKLNSLRNQ